jgi:hypothetical protein
MSQAATRFQSAEAPRGVSVGDGGKTKMTIAERMADQRGAARGQFHGARHPFGQRASSKKQQGLVPPHSGTAASYQHVPSAAHMEMITLGFETCRVGLC